MSMPDTFSPTATSDGYWYCGAFLDSSERHLFSRLL